MFSDVWRSFRCLGMKIAIYNENCTLKGQGVSERKIEDDGWDCGDWTVYKGTAEDLLEIAYERERHARPAGGGVYDRQVAETLREFACDARPDLQCDRWAEEDAEELENILSDEHRNLAEPDEREPITSIRERLWARHAARIPQRLAELMRPDYEAEFANICSELEIDFNN